MTSFSLFLGSLLEFASTEIPQLFDITQTTVINKAIVLQIFQGKLCCVSLRLYDDDDEAAKVGVTECTAQPTAYDHPTNSNIKFWDLPGIGTPNYPDLKTYCQKVELEKYHTFLIFTAGRFTENDLKLAKKIRSIDKNFFFIRTKIDENVRAEKRKRGAFNEDAMLESIRCNISEHLGDLLTSEQEIFLISNHHPAKWDFARLTGAVLDVLPTYQRESLTLSLGILTSLSTEILKRKVEVLKGRVWIVAAASAAAAVVPIPGLSVAVDIALIMNEISFYRSQLGLPEEGSAEFARLNVNTQEKVRKMCLTTAAQVSGFLAAYASESAIEEFSRFIPFVGLAIAGGLSFATTYCGLNHCLEKVEESALSVLREAAQRSADEMEVN